MLLSRQAEGGPTAHIGVRHITAMSCYQQPSPRQCLAAGQVTDALYVKMLSFCSPPGH